MITIPQARCPRCGETWSPRVPQPKRCPNGSCSQLWPLGREAVVIPAPVSCPKCFETWNPRVERPRKCPSCSMRWPLGRPEDGPN
jgi:predicted Zn-ribbon and HTH transcriptional regulator